MALIFFFFFSLVKTQSTFPWIFFSWTIDIFSINFRYLVFEISEAAVQRRRRPEVFCTKRVLKHLAKNFIKRKFWHRCFPVDFAKFLKTAFSTEHLQRLLLKFICQHTKEILYMNINFMGNQPWSKNKHFLLFVILILKKPAL